MNLPDLLGTGAPDVEITALAYDNRVVRPGTLFFCVPGFTRDGHDFAPDAVGRGAAALVVARPLGLGVPEVRVGDVRAAMARAAARFHGDPTAELPVVGVTGTSGKTTTTWLVRALLEAAGMPCGLLGTVTSVVAGAAAPLARTTPEAIDLQATFRAMLDGGDRACAMEVSSHALDLHRVDGVRFAVAAFTNLSQDHLDFHPDMEAYFAAKRRLFHDFDVGAAVVSTDDEWGRRLAAERPGAVTVAVERDADWRAVDVRPGLGGTAFRVISPAGEADVTLPLRGRFNAANALVALACGHALGLSLEGMAAALAAAPPVPGRVQPVEEGQPFAVLVDYSHKPAALENVLATARDMAAGRVIVVFGAGGDRDRGKRPVMGAIAAQLADIAVVTSDNPRSEAPEAIIDEILAGVPEGAAGVERIADRRAAIARAVSLAGAGDVVVIAGKGHERGQEFAGGRKEPFDDVAVAREALRAARAEMPA
ncbi:MAG TPA: UDP-N-acetylmuramoyl-L-alanyl-D-glutamate--2,6-diaminopimelate ligase [Solirubrobacteraceae bacterium]|nr:UDP-N-acetylmuramoyl-L-alanyl-D-glutamate--2,6-diaminopimelate ligase [Solirubrobacteraceae bacterium]